MDKEDFVIATAFVTDNAQDMDGVRVLVLVLWLRRAPWAASTHRRMAHTRAGDDESTGKRTTTIITTSSSQPTIVDG